MNIRRQGASRLAAGAAGIVGVLLVMAVGLAPVTACGHGSTEPTSACGRVYAQLGGGSMSMVIVGCNPGGGQNEQTLTNISYGPDGPVSFDFDVRCTTTGERHTGSVYSIRYQAAIVVGHSLKVDGQDCGPQ